MARTTFTSSTGARLNDTGLLLFRLVLGAVFIAHGWQKFHDFGFGGQADAFEGMGIPVPAVSAAIVIVLELIGGVLLLVGAFTRVLGVLFLLDMLGAIAFVHADMGFFAANGGWEFVAVLGAGGLLFALSGAGRFSVDGLVAGRREMTSPARPEAVSSAAA